VLVFPGFLVRLIFSPNIGEEKRGPIVRLLGKKGLQTIASFRTPPGRNYFQD
jgi:hypothetical protein